MADEQARMSNYLAEDIVDNIDEVREARGEYDSLDERLNEIEGGGPSPSNPIASNCVSPMTGYSKSSSSTPGNISTDDTLNAAIGKLEKRTELNENNISTLTANGGGKNKFNIDTATIYVSDASYTKNSDGTINVTKSTNTIGQVNMQQAFRGETGTYIISGCPSGGSSTTYEMLVQSGDSGDTVLGRDYGEGATVSLTKGTNYQFKVVVRANQTLSNKLFKPMISVEGGDYQPYALSNANLTNHAFSKIVFDEVIGYPAQERTYQMKTTDFGKLAGCGIYMIYIISWEQTPNIAIYTAGYSGGIASYSVLQKITGNDRNISISGDTITINVTGKVQIVALQ